MKKEEMDVLIEELRETQKERRYCTECSTGLPIFWQDDVCPACQERLLFSKVRDYVRANDVKETDVAEHFGIPIRKVRQWIREGRLEYKTAEGQTYHALFCQICGKPVGFGTVCADCMRLEKLQVVARARSMDNSRMRFLDGEIKKK